MVEPLLSSEEEEDEPTGNVPAEGDNPGQDESLFPTGRRLDVQQQLAVERGRHLSQGRCPLLMRRESLESLGQRISRLSQSGGGPRPAPSRQPALGQEVSPHGGPCSGEDLLAIALLGEDPAAGRPWRAPAISAGRSGAGARRGSARGGLLGDSRAGTRGLPSRKALGLRWQEPPALWGWRGGDVTLAVEDAEKEGAGSRQRRAPCSAHRTNTAVGAPGRCGTWADVSSCPGGVAQSWWQRGKQRAVLPCKHAAGQPASPRWSLQRSQEGTRELGSGMKGTRSRGDRASLGRGRGPVRTAGRGWSRRERKHRLCKKRNRHYRRGSGSWSIVPAPSCGRGRKPCTSSTCCSRRRRWMLFSSSRRPWSRKGLLGARGCERGCGSWSSS
ncbi:uncharacterized protein LOC142604215 isoform X2 [Balearica regulorum gibbericeps]